METTTETLFATLDPEAREEALRLAARLQAQDGESVGLVAAARAAGIEDRFLREAVGRMAPTAQMKVVIAPVAPAVSSAGVVGLVLAGVVFALVHVSPRFGGELSSYVLAFLFPFALAALAPHRSRWIAPLAVLATSIVAHLLIRMSGAWSGYTAFPYLIRATGIETVLAALGALLTDRLVAPISPSSTPVSASMRDSEQTTSERST